jgi:hypothetical protein
LTKRSQQPASRVAPGSATRSGRRAPEPDGRPAPLVPPWGDILAPGGPFLVPLLVLVLARAAFWISLPFAAEDAYITFRYARNFAHGFGLVFNPGEHVMGFTSAPWTLWIALGDLVTRDPLLWSRAWTVAGDAATLLLMGSLLRRHASLAAAWCFNAFFAAWPFLAAVSTSGMENNLMFTLIVLTAALIERRSPLSGPLLGLVALWRPEGLAAAGVMALGARGRDRIVALGVVAAGAAALAATFGSPIPQSVFAKSKLYGMSGPWLGRHWWEWISPIVMGRWPSASEGNTMVPLAVIFAPALVLGVPEVWRARRSGLALAIAGALVVWLGYALLGVAYFYWYMVVPLGGLAALAAVGLPHVLRGRAVYAAAALFVVSLWSVAPVLYLGRARAEYNSFGAVATYLLEHVRPGEKLMLEPIGMIGYHVPVRIVDEIGLVSPAVVQRRLQGPGWYSDIARLERPDWLVVRRSVLETGEAWAGVGAPFRDAAERDSLLAHYQAASYGDRGAGDQAMVVLRRVR